MKIILNLQKLLIVKFKLEQYFSNFFCNFGNRVPLRETTLIILKILKVCYMHKEKKKLDDLILKKQKKMDIYFKSKWFY